MTAAPEAPDGARRAEGAFADAGLFRPRARARVAGVCAALGDSTGTDPLLWRVVLAVLVAFGGLGLVLYCACWLLFPGDGDDASALQSLFGQGRSRTSKLLAAALFLGVLIGGLVVLLRDAGWPLVTTGLFGLSVIALNRQRAVVASSTAEATGAFDDDAGATRVMGGEDDRTRVMDADGPGRTRLLGEESPTGPDGTRVIATAPIAESTAPEGRAVPASRRVRRRFEAIVAPLFADSGPDRTDAARVDTAPDPGARRRFRFKSKKDDRRHEAGHGPAGPSRAERRRRRRAERAGERGADRRPSRAGRVTALLMMIALAVLLIIAATPVEIPFSLFASVMLALCGAGLVVASRRGGSSGLAWFGTLLAVVLVGAIGIDRLGPIGYQSFTITEVSSVPDYLEANLGETEIDMSAVSFTEIPGIMAVSVTMGHMQIVVPPDVDVVVNVDESVLGSVILDEETVGGPVGTGLTLFSDGPDGPGGGSITIDASVALGTVEIIR